MTSTMTDQADNVMSREEVIALLDREAKHYLGMTADEFLDAARRDELPDHPIVAHLVLLAGEGAC